MSNQASEDRSAQELLRKLLEQGSLYLSAVAPAELHQGQYISTYYARLPSTIELWCENSKCLRVMEWDSTGTQNDDRILANRLTNVTYKCRHSPEQRVTFVVQAAHTEPKLIRVELVGRTPRFRPHLAQEIARALGDMDKHWYSQALEARSRDMGVAALAYMRRVIENEMNRILDFLIEALSSETAAGQIVALQAAKELHDENAFEKKARAADAVLSKDFFPGDRNPFITLHALCSEGVHQLDDFESSERFDDAKGLFELLFEKLAKESENRRLFAERAQRLKPRTRPKP